MDGTILRELRRTSTLISDLSAGAVEKGKERLRNRFAQTASSSPRQSLHLFSLRSAMSDIIRLWSGAGDASFQGERATELGARPWVPSNAGSTRCLVPVVRRTMCCPCCSLLSHSVPILVCPRRHSFGRKRIALPSDSRQISPPLPRTRRSA